VNIAISDRLQKTRFRGLHVYHRKYRCIFSHFYLMGPESYRVWQNKAITPFRVTDFGIESSLCDFLSEINTNLPYLLSCTVSKLWPITGQILPSDRRRFTSTPSLGVIPANIQINFTSPETRRIPDAESCTIVFSFVWTKHRNVK